MPGTTQPRESRYTGPSTSVLGNIPEEEKGRREASRGPRAPGLLQLGLLRGGAEQRAGGCPQHLQVQCRAPGAEEEGRGSSPAG